MLSMPTPVIEKDDFLRTLITNSVIVVDFKATKASKDLQDS